MLVVTTRWNGSGTRPGVKSDSLQEHSCTFPAGGNLVEIRLLQRHSMTDITTIYHDDGKTQRVEASIELPRITEWYWVCGKEDPDDRWLGCVVQVGSNFVELRGPCEEGRGHYSSRIHLDVLDERLIREPNHKEIIEGRVKGLQNTIAGLIGQIQELSTSLGVSPVARIQSPQKASGTALAVMSSQVDVGAYQKALITAKEETVPSLQKKIREETETLSNWLKAEIIPFQAQADDVQSVINAMTDRVFNLELYAGLIETVHQFADGEPAGMAEKLRVFQRMLFCDEEALLAYNAGGMDITDMSRFKEWLALPANRDRILPFPRCLVAMRVRRNTKARSWDGSLSKLFENLGREEGDKKTFLFIRNGERLYCLNTGIEFDELIFPNEDAFDPTEPLMVKMFGRTVDKLMPRREFEFLLEEKRALKMKSDQWEAENPRSAWEEANPGRSSFGYEYANPYRYTSSFDEHDWRSFDGSNVYFDEAFEKINDEFKKYNRVAVIIQGLFDRSDCLAPHPAVRSWTSEGFRSAIELIYDSMGLMHGEPPSFEEYRARCNSLIDENSVLLGQEDAWLEKEAETECKRIDNSWRSSRDTYRPKRFQPYGDEGPGYFAQPSKVMKRAQKVVFTWMRARRSGPDRFDSTIRASITVPFDGLFNVSAYRPGDYRIFFQDPRTRERYLQWAPMLIAAEDFYSKGGEVQQPVE